MTTSFSSLIAAGQWYSFISKSEIVANAAPFRHLSDTATSDDQAMKHCS